MSESWPQCACFHPPFDYRDFHCAEVGIDDTNGRFGRVTLETCRRCGTVWLVYQVEYEAFSGSGRWFRGVIASEDRSAITPRGAAACLEGLPWYFAGGSYFNSPGVKSRGKLALD
jgi:hypothetical protein